MKKLNKETFNLNEFAKDLNDEFNGRTIVHKKFGKGVIKGFSASAVILFRVDFEEGEVKNLSWDACMEKNLLESDSISDSMRMIYADYNSLVKEIERDRRIEDQKQKELKEKEAKEQEEREAYDRYVKACTTKAKSYMNPTNEDERIYDNDDNWIKANIKYITAQVPDFLDKWFRSIFLDAGYSVIDSHRMTSGGYKMKWGLSLSATVKYPESAPSSIKSKMRGNKITDTGFLFGLALNNGIQIGK